MGAHESGVEPPALIAWHPTPEEVDAIVAEMRPLIDALAEESRRRQCASRSLVRLAERRVAPSGAADRANRDSATPGDTSSSRPLTRPSSAA